MPSRALGTGRWNVTVDPLAHFNCNTPCPCLRSASFTHFRALSSPKGIGEVPGGAWSAPSGRCMHYTSRSPSWYLMWSAPGAGGDTNLSLQASHIWRGSTSIGVGSRLPFFSPVAPGMSEISTGPLVATVCPENSQRGYKRV